MKTNVIYVAGPFRGSDAWEVERNVQRAEAAAWFVAGHKGCIPLCPHTMFRHFDKSLPDQIWLDGTLELLRRCDAMIAISGWSKSAGTMAEIVEAERLGLPVFYSFVELESWLRCSASGLACTPRRRSKKGRRGSPSRRPTVRNRPDGSSTRQTTRRSSCGSRLINA